MILFEKLQQVKEMITQLVVYWTIIISKTQGDDNTTGCLLDYNYFKNYHRMIAIDLSKQQARDADPKAIQQIHFTGNLASG